MSDRLIHDWLARAAEAEPNRVAVTGLGRSLTYATLDDRSSRLAALLADHGVRPGDRVGLFIEKSPEALLGIYSVLKAGATYVPLDEQAPAGRLAFIARDADIRVLITSRACSSGWPKLLEAGAPLETLVVVDAQDAGEVDGLHVVPGSAIADYDAALPSPAVDADDLAYVLYTSGSTGEPKGVMLSHRNALAFVEWAAELLDLRPADRLSSHAPFHFDLSTFDLFAAAVAASTVVLVPRETSVFPTELARFIRDEQITVWYSVPSILTMLVLRGSLASNHPDALRVVLFAGEVFPTKHLRSLMTILPAARFFNFFGPTETNVCTWYEVPRPVEDVPDDLPIGRPIGGVGVVVADEDGQPVPDGDVGELLVHGPTVMSGYLGRPEQSGRVLGTFEGERRYRTGDLVRADADGNLVFLGRRDNQIKSRGYRIELGEIERAIDSMDAVVECAVVPIPDELVTNRLKAFVVGGEALTETDVVGHCRERLPSYMVPDQIEFRDSLPKSSTGKIDRKKLADDL